MGKGPIRVPPEYDTGLPELVHTGSITSNARGLTRVVLLGGSELRPRTRQSCGHDK